jgi:cephalosporin-C deacetylase
MTEEEMYHMLSYFDTKNLATLITCPVYMDFSLQDNICPPHTNWAPYNNLKSTEKQYLVNPTLGHETAANWWNLFFAWFKEHMKRSGIEEFSLLSPNDGMQPVYNLQGVMVAPAGTPLSALSRGVYIIGGRKVVR